MKITVELDKVSSQRFQALAERLQLPYELAGKACLMAAVEAMEHEPKICWPPFLGLCHFCARYEIQA